jgi:hypothetical protein
MVYTLALLSAEDEAPDYTQTDQTIGSDGSSEPAEGSDETASPEAVEGTGDEETEDETAVEDRPRPGSDGLSVEKVLEQSKDLNSQDELNDKES